MPALPSGADALANDLLESLTTGESFDVPAVDLSDDIFDQPGGDGELFTVISRLTNDEFTTGVVGGTGVFDTIMSSLSVHLKSEYEAGRITGQEYTKAYIGGVTAALQTGLQFLLGRDQAYLGALLAQRQARIAAAEEVVARVGIETAKVTLAKAQIEANVAEATYGLTKIKIATEDAGYAGISLDNQGKEYAQANIMPRQKELLQEQIESTRAQTMDTRTDGTTAVTGVLGKQKALYSQQITSYQRDAETKFVKIFADSWTVQKTMDEALLPPSNFQNVSLDAVLTKLKNNLDLD